MRKFGKLAAACALAAVLATLTACGGESTSAPQQSRQGQAGSLAGALSESLTRR